MAPTRPAISLVQATYRAGDRAVATRDTWFDLALHPERIEHHFGYTSDDIISMATPEIATHPALDASDGRITAVSNWNGAALRARGKLVFAIADDLVPSQLGWDEALLGSCGSLDPNLTPFVIKVSDGQLDGEHIIRHPVVSAAYLRNYGMFSPAFEGYGADNDFTLRAHLNGLVLDARSICFDHQHPTRGFTHTESHDRLQSAEARTRAREVLEEVWPIRRRRVWFRYFRPRKRQRRVSRARCLLRGLIARSKALGGLVPAGVRSRLRGAVRP